MASPRPGRGGVPTSIAVVALVLVALLVIAAGVVVAAWHEAKEAENDSLVCSFGMRRTDVGVLVRDHPVGKLCVYLGGAGRPRGVAPMACVEGKLEFETRGGALLDVRKTPTGFRCLYHDGAGHILRVRHVEER